MRSRKLKTKTKTMTKAKTKNKRNGDTHAASFFSFCKPALAK